jgi:hypothetical protein
MKAMTRARQPRPAPIRSAAYSRLTLSPNLVSARQTTTPAHTNGIEIRMQVKATEAIDPMFASIRNGSASWPAKAMATETA